MGYIFTVLKTIDIPRFLPHDGMVCVETGMENTSENPTAILNENKVTHIDEKLASLLTDVIKEMKATPKEKKNPNV